MYECLFIPFTDCFWQEMRHLPYLQGHDGFFFLFCFLHKKKVFTLKFGCLHKHLFHDHSHQCTLETESAICPTVSAYQLKWIILQGNSQISMRPENILENTLQIMLLSWIKHFQTMVWRVCVDTSLCFPTFIYFRQEKLSSCLLSFEMQGFQKKVSSYATVICNPFYPRAWDMPWTAELKYHDFTLVLSQ